MHDDSSHPAVNALVALRDGEGPLSQAEGWTPERARRLAEIAHAGQVDKAGEPYIGHPARVVLHGRERASGVAAGDLEIVAWLHDVLEDTPVTTAHLRAAGMPEHLIDALSLLDHSDKRPYDEYVEALAHHPLARAAKLADLTDNADPQRLAKLEPEIRERLEAKYGPVRDRLAALDAGSWLPGSPPEAGPADEERPPPPLLLDHASRFLGERKDESGNDAVWIRSSESGGLTVSGQSLGSTVEHVFGGDEYEWAVSVDPHDLPRLADLLDVELDDVFDAVAHRFSGRAAFRLRAYLDEHDLIADRFSWVSGP